MWRFASLIVICGLWVAHAAAQETDSFSAAFDGAVAAYQAGDFAKAEAGFLRCAEGRADDPILLTWLGCVRLKLGQWADARTILLRALDKDPGYAPALANLAEAQVALSQWAEAAESYRAALKARPQWPEVRARAAAVLERLGRHDDACALWREAVQRDPQDARALCQLGAAYQAAGQPDEALDACRRAHELGPADPDCTLLLARMSAAAGKPDVALSLLDDPAVAGAPPAEKAELRGRVLMALGRPEEALGLLREAIEAGRTTYANYGLLASAEATLGDFENARRDYGSALASADDAGQPPSNAVRLELLNNLGHALIRLQQFGDAVNVLGEALAIDPHSAAVQANLADAYLALGDGARAGAQLEALLAARPGDPALLGRILDLALAGSGYEPSDEVLAALAGALPEDFERLSRLGVLLLRRGRAPEAMKALQQAVAQNRYSIGAHNNLGVALELSGQLEAALNEYETAYHLDPSADAARQNRDRVMSKMTDDQ